jgi:acyl-CoA synthetase (AMP-forming)/AMP-acid ligase II
MNAAGLAGGRFRLSELLRLGAHLNPDVPALGDALNELSFAATLVAVRRLATDLGREGVAAGDLVAVVARNSIAAAITYLAAWELGAVVAPVNYRLQPAAIADQLELLSPAAIAVDPAYLELMPPDSLRLLIEPSGNRWLKRGRRRASGRRLPTNGGVDDPAVVIHTSGTTSEPRAIALSHRGIARNTLALAPHLGIRPGDRFLVATPLCHVGGVIRLANALYGGATVVFQERWDPDAFLSIATGKHITQVMLVGAMLSDLADQPSAQVATLRHLRLIYYGAGRTAPVLVRRLHELLPDTGWLQGYGQTEVSGGVTLLTQRDHIEALAGKRPQRLDSVGQALPGTQVATLDPDRRLVGAGVPGEVAVTGEGLMLGFLKSSGLEPPPFEREWLLTGDIGSFDEDGYLFILNRRRDIVKSGGLSVATGEVENRLLEYPPVLEAAVVGIPDERLGEAVAAFVVVRRTASQPDAEEIRSWLAGSLSGFQVPRRIWVLPELPRTAAGKVDKGRLRELARARSHDGEAHN